MVKPMKDMCAARGQISDIISGAVVETFTNMFGQDVIPNTREPLTAPDNAVMACVKLHQGEESLDFCFKFDMRLLLLAASRVFKSEYLQNNPVHEDIACEIVNIVCAKVKAFLNERGYQTEMGFPFIPSPAEAERLLREQVVHMHFFYRDSDAQQGVGVAVNFTVA
jgi:hypothetical protein